MFHCETIAELLTEEDCELQVAKSNYALAEKRHALMISVLKNLPVGTPVPTSVGPAYDFGWPEGRARIIFGEYDEYSVRRLLELYPPLPVVDLVVVNQEESGPEEGSIPKSSSETVLSMWLLTSTSTSPTCVHHCAVQVERERSPSCLSITG